MKFAHPWILYSTPVIVAIAGWLLSRAMRKRREWIAAFAGPGQRRWADPGFVARRTQADFCLTLAVVVFLGLTLARPLAFRRNQQSELQGVPYIVALDASRSMLATDVKPTRYG